MKPISLMRRLKNKRAGLAVAVAGIGVILIAVVLVVLRPKGDPAGPAIPPEVARMDLDTLRRQVPLAEARVGKLAEKTERLFPSGPAILIDTAANRIYLLRGSRVVLEDRCSTGSGLELTDTQGKRTWTFETPRGYYRVLSKVSNPVWYRPDWAFIEEGEPIPKDRASRAVADVLGDYAIAFGDGYFIHGTLYTRMLGSSVTHGCVRVDDDSLKKIYEAAQPGTPIWIY
jgi:L,D-transpeptidase ErfK/SrfK